MTDTPAPHLDGPETARLSPGALAGPPAERWGTDGRPFADPRFRPLVEAFRELFGRRRDGGGALAVVLRGQPVVDVWAGYADVKAGTPWRRDTMAMSFSTSKGVASTAVHRLVQQGVLDVDEPVATWWPEFADRGKERITLADVLTHQAGLHRVRGIADAPGDLLDHRRMAAVLARRRPEPELGRPAYHGITYGYLVAAIVEHATGRRFTDVVREEIAEPLGLDGLHISTPSDQHHRIAPFYQSLGPSLGPIDLDVARAGHWIKKVPRLRPFVDALLPHGFDTFLNTPMLYEAVMPAANGVFTARSLAGMYAALAGDVDGFLDADVRDALGRVRTRRRDAVLGVRMRWRLGYHQAFVLGPEQPRMGFGHFGLGGSGGWADPESGLAIGFVTNRLGAATTPIADVRLARLGAVALECARTT